jgi:hypothetical protein
MLDYSVYMCISQAACTAVLQRALVAQRSGPFGGDKFFLLCLLCLSYIQMDLPLPIIGPLINLHLFVTDYNKVSKLPF